MQSKHFLFLYIKSLKLSSRGGLEVERMLHKLHDAISVGSNPAWQEKNFSERLFLGNFQDQLKWLDFIEN